jgi:hypothetical protein
MRKIVMIFAALAALKVWFQDRFYRSVMQDALVQAYRERAAVVCQKEAQKPGKTGAGQLWPATAAAEVSIGSPAGNVALWDFDNPLWDVRYRHPHLVLTAPGIGAKRCAYDLSVGIASFTGG